MDKLNGLMAKMPAEWRYRWCEAKMCFCLGGANCSGGLPREGVTKEEWQNWVAKNPEPPDSRSPIEKLTLVDWNKL